MAEDELQQELGRAQKRMKESAVTVEDINRTAAYLLHNDPFKSRAPTNEELHFRALFGCSPLVAQVGWNMMLALDVLPEKAEIQHYLWALMDHKVYPTRKAAKQLTGVDPKTYKKWVHLMTDAIVELEAYVIKWRNRYKGDINNDCLTSTDCTDFRIPGCGRKFASHKFKKKSGLRYEVCVAILSGDLVWINGPYECGKWPDIKVFRNALISMFDEGEMTSADKGYYGECPECCKCPGHITSDPDTVEQEAVVRSRTETINNRFKQWGILRQCYRSLDFERHAKSFRFVAIHTQLAIENGEPLFSVEHIDPYVNDLFYFENNGYEGYEHVEDEEEEEEQQQQQQQQQQTGKRERS